MLWWLGVMDFLNHGRHGIYGTGLMERNLGWVFGAVFRYFVLLGWMLGFVADAGRLSS